MTKRWGVEPPPMRLLNPRSRHGVRARSAVAGVTVVEFLVALSLVAIIGSMHMLVASSTSSHDMAMRRAVLHAKGVTVLQSVVEALRFVDALPPAPSPPLSSPRLDFSLPVYDDATGVQTGVRPESLAFDPQQGTVTWISDPGTANESTRVLCRNVPGLAAGETLDVADENGNGLLDESGFSVTREGDSLVVRLSLSESPGVRNPLSVTLTSRVCPRVQ